MAKVSFGRGDTHCVRIKLRLDDGEVVVVEALRECDWYQGLNWEYGGGARFGLVQNLVF